MEPAIWAAWIAGGASVAVALISLAPKVLEHRRARRQRREQAVAIQGVADLYERRFHVYTVLRHLLRETRAHRVLILRSENGGGIPQTGSPIYVTVVFEDHDHHLPSVRSAWQRRSVDEWYEHLLSRVVTQGRALVVRDEIPPGVELRDLYQAHGIGHSRVYRIGVSTGRAVLYLSLNFREDAPELTATERVAIDNGMARLRSAFAGDHLLMTPPPDWAEGDL